MGINRETFFSGYRAKFGELSQGQVNGLNFLLDSFENDPAWKDPRNAAYALATILIETAHTFQPIHEIGSDKYLSKYWTNPRLRTALGNIEPTDAQRYKGRGYIQCTGRTNYRKFGLEKNPETAIDPVIAFHIMTRGMVEGLFTGKKLSDYINNSETDYVNARRIINSLDRASEIAHDASMFESILRKATA